MGLFGNQPNQPTKLNSIHVTQSVLGTVIPIIMGQGRVPGRLVWYGDWKAIQQKQNVGGKGIGGGNVTTYVYQAAVQEVLCQGPILGLVNVWDSGGRFTSLQVSEQYTVPGGGGSYTVANQPNYNLDNGVGRTDAYSFSANDYGSPGPVTYSGNYQTRMTLVSSGPTSGQYTQSNGTYTFSAADAGKVMTIAYSFSMYYIITAQTDSVPTTTPYQITVNQSANFYQDLGVVYYPSGNKFTLVTTTPTVAGTYQYLGAGVYKFAAADAAQGIQINYSYKDTSANQSYNSVLNATVFTGTNGQSIWGYLSSKHPDQSLGYTQLAHFDSAPFYLGPNGETPNYNFEVAGLYQWGNGVVDAHPVDCITGILTDPSYGLAPPIPNANLDNWKSGNSSAYNYWAAAGFFVSPVLDNQQTVASVVQQWLDAGNVGMIWSEGLLKLRPYGDTTLVSNGYQFTPPTTPVVDLNDDDFIVPEKTPQEPIQVQRKDWQDAYNRVTVEYLDRLNGYNPQPVYEQDDASVGRFGLRNESPQSWHFITTLTAAQFAAQIRLKRQSHIWNTYTFQLGWNYSYLEPMDLVTVTDSRLGYNKLPVRITEIKDNPDGTLDITAEDFPWGTATATAYPKQASVPFQPFASQADPGDTEAVVFAATSRLSLQVGDTFYLFVAGGNPNWGGCNVWTSFDNTNYELFTTITSPGRIGVLGTTFPTGSDPDNTNTLNAVMLPGAVLGSVTHAQADNYETLCAVCNSDGSNCELVSYATATLTSSGSGNTYNLTYLRRGIYGSSIASHSAGSLFARLDQASFTYTFDPTYYGQTIYFKFTSFNTAGNREQQLANVNAVAFVIPSNLQGAIAATNGVLLTGTPGSAVATIDRQVALATGAINQNMIDNPGFEINATVSSGDLVAGWEAAGVVGTWVIQPETNLSFVYQGVQAIYVSLRSNSIANGGSVLQAFQHDRNFYSILPGQIYYLSVWARWDKNATFPAGVTANAFAALRIHYSDGSTQDFLTSQLTQSGTLGTWTNFTGTITIPTPTGKTISFAYVFCEASVTNNSGSTFSTGSSLYWDIRFDDISLVRLSSLDTEVQNGVVYAKQAQFTTSLAIDNANFEASAAMDPVSLMPPGWTYITTAPTVSYLTGGSQYDGNQSLQVRATAGTAVWTSKKFKVTPGEVYRVSAAMHGDGSSVIANTEFQIYNASGSVIASAIATSTSSSSWQYLIGNPTIVPSGGVSAQLALYGTGYVGVGNSAFDDILVEKLLQGANVSYRPLTNPLTGHDAGSNATINIASFTMRLAGIQDIGDNSGSITGLSYSTLYYVYYDDPFFQGGAVTYQATTTKSTAMNGYYRYYVGSVLTPISGGSDTIGNNDGGGGAQNGTLFIAYPAQLTGSDPIWTNVNNYGDGDQNTFTQATVTGNSTRNTYNLITGLLKLPVFPSSAVYTVKLKYAVTTNTLNGVNGGPGGVPAPYRFFVSAAYVPFGGSSQVATTLVTINPGVTSGATIASLILPVTANPNSITFTIQAAKDTTDTTGTLVVQVYESWLEVQI